MSRGKRRPSGKQGCMPIQRLKDEMGGDWMGEDRTAPDLETARGDEGVRVCSRAVVGLSSPLGSDSDRYGPNGDIY